MSEVKFKVGDLVYYPAESIKIRRLSLWGDDSKLSVINFPVTEAGYLCSDDGEHSATPFIVHATQEKYELLSKLHPNVAFESPPKHKEPREIIEAMLDNDYPFVLSSKENYALFLCSKPNINEFNLDDYFIVSKETGKIIIDFVDGEVVLESENANL